MSPRTTEQAAPRIAGVFYLITFITSVPALALERPALRQAGFAVSAGPAGGLLAGGVLDLVNAAAAVGTAVTLYPLLRRHHAGLALGFVASRLAEAAAILTSVAAILALAALHQAGAASAGADRAALIAAGRSLAALHDAAFLLGPGLIPAVNAVLLGTILYRTGLVPRAIPLTGLIGAPILAASAAAAMLGVFSQVSAPAGLAALPVGAWELSLGLWLTIRGMRTAPAEQPEWAGAQAVGRRV